MAPLRQERCSSSCSSCSSLVRPLSILPSLCQYKGQNYIRLELKRQKIKPLPRRVSSQVRVMLVFSYSNSSSRAQLFCFPPHSVKKGYVLCHIQPATISPVHIRLLRDTYAPCVLVCIIDIPLASRSHPHSGGSQGDFCSVFPSTLLPLLISSTESCR
jgi:hypothetical protein